MSGLRPRPMIITIAITLITRFMDVVGDLKLLSYFYVNLSGIRRIIISLTGTSSQSSVSLVSNKSLKETFYISINYKTEYEKERRQEVPSRFYTG